MLRPIEMEVNGQKVPLVIKIDGIAGLKHAGEFRCYFNLTLLPWDIKIYSCKLMEGEDGNLHAYFPRRSYKYQGQTLWADHVSIGNAQLRDEIALCAREALQSA